MNVSATASGDARLEADLWRTTCPRLAENHGEKYRTAAADASLPNGFAEFGKHPLKSGLVVG